jgi:Integrase core domain
LRRPLESAQYTSYAFTQLLDNHGVLASIGSVGDAYDNALAESFVDSFKTELIADRVWCNRSQLELAVVEYIGWFNHDRLHEALGDIPPVEFEQRTSAQASISGNGSVAALPPSAAGRLHAARLERERASEPETALSGTTGPASPATPAQTHP